jgi:hypothetical protein
MSRHHEAATGAMENNALCWRTTNLETTLRGEEAMKATQKLHELGQSIWLDNITRDLLTGGTLKRYIGDLSLTGLTSNPTIFDHAIKNSSAYDSAIRAKLKEGKSGEKLFFELAIEDLSQAADMFRPVWDRTSGVDGWVSLEHRSQGAACEGATPESIY